MKKAIVFMLMVCIWVCHPVQAGSTIVLLAEDFESLPLGPNVDEGLAGEAVWTNIPSPGWINDASGVPGVGDPATDGVTEWAGWGFANKDWWVQTAEDQNRSQFDLGQGTVAIADPDEWDDAGHPEPIASDPYDVWLSTPPIDLSVSKPGTVQIQFDSSWRPEFDDDYHQSANLTVSFDGGEPVELFRWVSDSGSPNFKGDATNETVFIEVDNPASASSMVLTFGLFDAGNDWWWAIDNILVTAEQRADRAYNPGPLNGTDELSVKTVLSWTPGQYVAGLSPQHRVLLSDSLDAVEDGSAVVSTQDANSLDAAGRLEYSTTYYWRVDEANQVSAWDKGSIWKFTTEPYSISIPVGNVTASSSAPLNLPTMTINGSGMNGLTHSTASEDMWLSGPADFSPWLMCEFDQAQKLDQMWVWNSNTTSEGFIGWGVKGVTIETSLDGVDWTVPAEAMQFDRAPGLPTYDTPQVVELGLVHARYVRLSIQDNWGGILPQYGLSEVQFYGLPVHAREPKPATGAVDVRPDVTVSWRAGREAVQHTVYVSADQNAVAEGLAPSASSMTNRLGLTEFGLDLGGTYYWRVDEVNEAETMTVWTGPVWSFSTGETVAVDDFEGYGNLSPDRPFQTWVDGYGYSADEFFPVAYPGNGTGAGIGHDIWSPSSPNFNGQLMERSITLPGSKQSMPFYYTNTGGTASQTERQFTPAQDWTVGGAKILSLAFYGQVDNTGILYCRINNVKLTYPGDAGDLAGEVWQIWNIDLATVNTNLQSITTMAIGVDGSGASGRILIDDIRLSKVAQ
jgi:hypothetical protein